MFVSINSIRLRKSADPRPSAAYLLAETKIALLFCMVSLLSKVRTRATELSGRKPLGGGLDNSANSFGRRVHGILRRFYMSSEARNQASRLNKRLPDKY